MGAKQKGGSAATTVARELGVAAAAAGQRVVFIDLDPQGTLRSWWNRRTEGTEVEPNPALATPAPAQMTKTPFAKSSGGEPPAIGMGEAVQHQADRGQGDHGLGDLG